MWGKNAELLKLSVEDWEIFFFGGGDVSTSQVV